MREDTESLSYTKWNCKYHIVFATKYRRQIIYGKSKASIGKIIRDLCEREGFFTKMEIAKNLLSMGIPVEQISQGTGLSVADILNLATIHS